ncbi:endolytic transglycosylase MltG [Massilia cavernae]|uniref:Endolytic murein transglycosylase n=1 Tax=Massilia cavernae TaxID=2320864 RepID=A0A418XEE1_9BURK|nr:endolytic transglycosylase MltG [Massilia cavernae]RJG10703.1 endolytic transglycosylase MltG [Massilia cavernae]
MAFIRKIAVAAILVTAAAAAGFAYWAGKPITTGDEAIAFTVLPGSGVASASQQIAAAGVPVNPTMLSMLARLTQKASRIKAGTYELKPDTTPRGLLDQMVRGEFAQESLTIIEGWTFRQMRAAVAANQGLKHDTVQMSDDELMAKVSSEFKSPEGLFFPDTYLFAKGASDLQIYKQAHTMLLTKLNAAWEKRAPNLPYTSPYQALIMASIVEKETGKESERPMIAAVFVNRLKKGMMLQTDPTVIYGIGYKFDGNIRKKDLETDTPYNTYTRTGLPPTPIALPGVRSLAAALGPADSDALYFVSRGDGTSQFSGNLTDHNRAVNKYQR